MALVYAGIEGGFHVAGESQDFRIKFQEKWDFAKRPIYLAAKERKDRKENGLLKTDAAFHEGDFKASRLKDL